MKAIIPGDNKSKGNRLIGFLSIACSIFIIIMAFVSLAELAFSLDYGPDGFKTLPPIQAAATGPLPLSSMMPPCLR